MNPNVPYNSTISASARQQFYLDPCKSLNCQLGIGFSRKRRAVRQREVVLDHELEGLRDGGSLAHVAEEEFLEGRIQRAGGLRPPGKDEAPVMRPLSAEFQVADRFRAAVFGLLFANCRIADRFFSCVGDVFVLEFFHHEWNV
jgi:hypothetical protein